MTINEYKAERDQMLREIAELCAESNYNLTRAYTILANLTDERTDKQIAEYEAEQERNLDHALDNLI